MAFGDGIKARFEQLKKIEADIPKTIQRCQKRATDAAIVKAAEQTPPNDSTPPRGVGTITGEAKSHWATDSDSNPRVIGDESVTILANNLDYISHVNYGHIMDEHFVPGLIVNPYSGLLEKVDPELGGITVGTQTDYVPGLYMREEGIDEYEAVLERELLEELRGLLDG